MPLPKANGYSLISPSANSDETISFSFIRSLLATVKNTSQCRGAALVGMESHGCGMPASHPRRNAREQLSVTARFLAGNRYRAPAGSKARVFSLLHQMHRLCRCRNYRAGDHGCQALPGIRIAATGLARSLPTTNLLNRFGFENRTPFRPATMIILGSLGMSSVLRLTWGSGANLPPGRLALDRCGGAQVHAASCLALQ